MAQSGEEADTCLPPPRLRPALRAVLSALFVIHLAGVFVAPLGSSIVTAVGRLPPDARPDQPPTLWLHRALRPYLDIAYLNHGYGFFAPDPGPSHLVRYAIRYQDGTEQKGTFPDRDRHWPRLRYHRYFMLAEQAPLNAGEAYARYLLRRYGAEQVTVERVRHFLPRPEEVCAGTALDAAELYRPLGTVTVKAGAPKTQAEPAL